MTDRNKKEIFLSSLNMYNLTYQWRGVDFCHPGPTESLQPLPIHLLQIKSDYFASYNIQKKMLTTLYHR